MVTMVSTGTTNFQNMLVNLISSRLQNELIYSTVYLSPGSFTPAVFQKGTNGTYIYPRIANLPIVTTPLTEGVNPSPQTLTIGYNTASSTQIGAYVQLTDLASLQSPYDLLSIASQRTARQAVVSLEALAKGIIFASTGSAQLYPSTATSVATVSSAMTMNGSGIKGVVKELEAHDVPRFGDGFYRCVISPSQKFALETDTSAGGWMDANKYTDATPLLNGDVGRYGGVRFLNPGSNAQIKTGAGSAGIDVHQALFYGPEYVAASDPSATIIPTFVPPNQPDHSDPLGLTAQIGWKFYAMCVITDAPGARFRIYSTAG